MILRKIQKDDLVIRVEWMNHPKVYNSMHFEIPILLDNTIKWYENNKDNNKRADFTFLDDDGNIVAFGGLTNIDLFKIKSELYIFVNPKIQAKGYGTEATKLLCDFGFNEIGLNKIYLITNSDNFAAQKVYERCGFKLEGTLRKEYLTANGEWKDRLYYGRLKNE